MSCVLQTDFLDCRFSSEQVQRERAGTWDDRRLAEQIISGQLDIDRSAEFNTFVAARLLALEWEIDRHNANALLI